MKKYILSVILLVFNVVLLYAQAPYFTFNAAADVNLVFPPGGAGGRAIVHGDSKALVLNYHDDFTGGTYLGRYFSLFHDQPAGEQAAYHR